MCDGPGPLETEYTLTILVQDINDNPPIFNSPLFATFEEGKLGFVVSPNVTDADSGINALFTVSIVAGNTVVFSIVNGVSIHVLMELDYETQTNYTLQLRAVDHGYPSLTSQTYYVIQVINVNDVAPVFILPPPSTPLSVTVLENTQEQNLFTLQASDGDAPPFNQIQFYFALDTPQIVYQHFSIYPTGRCAVIVEIDRETFPQFTFDVHAFDGTFNTTATIIVDIEDANDNPSVFQSPFQFYVAENASNDTFIGTVSITDDDIPPNDVVTLILMNSPILPFKLEEIDGFSARLLVDAALDYETRPSYSIVIVAIDIEGKM